jgi:hypothetical protein
MVCGSMNTAAKSSWRRKRFPKWNVRRRVIWALTRPVGAETTINLYAFASDMGGKNMTQLFLSAAGTWISNSTNRNLVPVVAKGTK